MTATAHAAHMARALELARQGLYTAHPNPCVGCVIVRDGAVVGEGWHRRAGEPHAEVHALHMAGKRARGATVYVTLEPCAHHGRTPPCADALLAAGVGEVVVAVRDPDPRTAGQGIERLRVAGIRVTEGVLEADARALNAGFFSRQQRQRPWVRVKLATSLDGRTALASGESQWITGAAARADVQRLRARSAAVITGIGTVLQDDPQLTVRDADALGLAAADIRQPLRVVLDSRGQMPAQARLLSVPGAVQVVTTAPAAPALRDRLQGKAIVQVAGDGPRVDLAILLQQLARDAQCNEVLVEAGATLAGSFIEAGLADELVIYMAPNLMGHEGRPLLQLPVASMQQRPELLIREIRAVGQDWRITAVPIQKEQD